MKFYLTVACCALCMGLVGPVLGQAVASPLSPKRLTHATLYSARVPIVEGRTIEEAERIAREMGSVEILQIPADGMVLEATQRELIRQSPGTGYPWFSVRTDELLAQQRAAGLVTEVPGRSARTTLDFAGESVDVVWTFPQTPTDTSSVRYSAAQQEIITVTIYPLGNSGTPGADPGWPRLIRTRGLDGDTDVVGRFLVGHFTQHCGCHVAGISMRMGH